MKNERIKLLAIMFALVVSVSGEVTNALTGEDLDLFNAVQAQEDTSDIEESDAGSVSYVHELSDSDDRSTISVMAEDVAAHVLANAQNLQDAGNPQDPDNLQLPDFGQVEQGNDGDNTPLQAAQDPDNTPLPDFQGNPQGRDNL